MSDLSLLLSLPLMQAAQAQKHITHNEALRLLDMIVQLSVTSRTLTSPPERPQAGNRYIIANGATGGWAGHDQHLAVHDGTAWVFVTPLPGWRAFVQEEGQTVTFANNAWTNPQAATLGVNTGADTLNRLSVRSAATLLTHEGTDHRLKVNKAASGNTASLLFQSNWSGRAEMGLMGNDAFAIKVSPDGGTFQTALEAANDGTVRVPQALQIRGYGAYHAGNILGTVALSGGTPTGAVIQTTEATDSRTVRFADGTQICTRLCAVDVARSDAQTFALPATFIGTNIAVTLSHPAATAHARLALGNIAALGAANGAFFLRLLQTGTSVSAAAEKVILTATGRWA
ncbi:DUF2793 domain-containing protein [Falsirhodobacter sp. 1013]|uniref:DUF2793 domain-containing protein n=1 Tax=Falsirhodobacter sp. 1013 TaxID=3417566 RepID=UPI003EB950AB